jgi:hypothetical protein
LIRAHQESHQNHFPDLERAAEEVGLKRLNLSIEDLIDIARSLGINIRWVTRTPQDVVDELGINAKQLVTSFFEPPGTIFLNEILKEYPTRLKYDLSVYIGHCILHSKEGLKSVLSVGNNNTWDDNQVSGSSQLNSQDILQAWRDFESSFFAGALLCHKVQ